MDSLLKSIERKCHTICHQLWLTNDIEKKPLLVMSVKSYPYLYKYVMIIKIYSWFFLIKKKLGGHEEKNNFFLLTLVTKKKISHATNMSEVFLYWSEYCLPDKRTALIKADLTLVSVSDTTPCPLQGNLAGYHVELFWRKKIACIIFPTSYSRICLSP